MLACVYDGYLVLCQDLVVQRAEEVVMTLHASLEQQLMAFPQSASHHHCETLRALDAGDCKSVTVCLHSDGRMFELILVYSCVHCVFAFVLGRMWARERVSVRDLSLYSLLGLEEGRCLMVDVDISSS